MKEQIPAIQIPVPEDFGDAYDGTEGRQWVQRRQRVGGTGLKQIEKLSEKISDDKMFKVICDVLSEMYLDWNLESDEGPLPKPYKNRKAFEALFESDFSLFMWVGTLPFYRVSTLTEMLQEKN